MKGYNRSWSRLILTLSLFVILITGCAKKTTATIITSQETTTSQEVTVGKGTITISITTSAIVDYADYENMSFGAGGNINEVNAKIGDLVKKDKKLATIIPSSWSPQIEDLAQSVQALQNNFITAQNNLADLQKQIVTAQSTLNQGQVDLQNAQNTFDNISAPIKTAQDAVNAAQADLDAAQTNLQKAQVQGDSGSASFLVTYMNQLRVVLAQRQLNLKQVQDRNAAALNDAQLNVIQKQNALIVDQNALDDANTAAANAQLAVTKAWTPLNEVQTNLDDLKTAAIQISAPFDGVITGLNINVSDTIKSGNTAIIIAETNNLVAKMVVAETDIDKVKIGMLASIYSSALPNVKLSATVNAIQLSGKNYDVTATLSPGSIHLQQGLPLTVNLIIQQKEDVLTVPNIAIEVINGKSYVQVKNGSGNIDEREVTIGLKDNQNTEIASGLTEGDVIVLH